MITVRRSVCKLTRSATVNTVLNLGNCTDCTAHSGALNAYLEARQMTNNWDTEIAAATATGHQVWPCSH